jgi:putative flippase GtrA
MTIASNFMSTLAALVPLTGSLLIALEVAILFSYVFAKSKVRGFEDSYQGRRTAGEQFADTAARLMMSGPLSLRRSALRWP